MTTRHADSRGQRASHSVAYPNAEILSDALHGPSFTKWALYVRIKIIWDQLELVNGRVDLDSFENLSQRARNEAGHCLIGSCNGLLKVP